MSQGAWIMAAVRRFGNDWWGEASGIIGHVQ
jgi:hypothetical protein